MKFLFLALFISCQLYGFDQAHLQWENILKKNIEINPVSNLFNYQNIKRDPKDFNLYLKSLEDLKKDEFEKFTDAQKLAFWINAYNAYTVKLIVDNYPVKSIKDIKPSGLFGAFSNPWKIKFINLFGEKYNLDNIEHDIIRKEFKNPYIHFAVNCASMGCPSLHETSYKADTLDKQLQAAAVHFVTNTHKNQYDSKKKHLYLSKIFKWYGDDFNEKFGSYLSFIEKTLKESSDKDISLKDYKVKWNEYDWNLNKK
ncbi:MAG: DUF547 domain-containing protein [Halobacteriovoraceae bacterium]|nr:DUF547 domain-containing protein [Halobacteriovoraceae bacterium]